MRLTSVCPVCNGLDVFRAGCPKCGHELADAGRVLDLFGDYSPYRPIDDLKMTDGLHDLESHRCPHQIWCPSCGHKEIRLIGELPL
ncbi:hypothetical protein [Staphylospora marina]|uniref:hypothetical protein n=1 Tax=Staphylospora marina TaxID=2490858 RepID=UPI000F5C00F6|nr:hypothetical protein [Staphylospora marina]